MVSSQTGWPLCRWGCPNITYTFENVIKVASWCMSSPKNYRIFLYGIAQISTYFEYPCFLILATPLGLTYMMIFVFWYFLVFTEITICFLFLTVTGIHNSSSDNYKEMLLDIWLGFSVIFPEIHQLKSTENFQMTSPSHHSMVMKFDSLRPEIFRGDGQSLWSVFGILSLRSHDDFRMLATHPNDWRVPSTLRGNLNLKISVTGPNCGKTLPT